MYVLQAARCCACHIDSDKLSEGALVFSIFIFAHLQNRNANFECFFSDELFDINILDAGYHYHFKSKQARKGFRSL